jgi:cobaltochelatase CobN
MLTSIERRLVTKRRVIGHVVMCRGCCCGDVNKGKPEIPVDWLKSEWRRRGLMKNIQLTISGCLGPCDLSNVISVSDSSGCTWLGNVRHSSQYSALLDWASECKAAEVLLPLPTEFDGLSFDPFRDPECKDLPEIVVRSA